MDFTGIVDRLKAIGAPGILGVDEPREKDPADKKDPGRAGDAFVMVDPEQLDGFLRFCRDDAELCFELLCDLTATDPAVDDENLWLNYNLLSIEKKHRLAIKAIIPKENASAPSVVDVYRAAQWHEREAAEMFGITYRNHPDPRHILLPEDWVGHPLRKDYEYPKEYRGISCE